MITLTNEQCAAIICSSVTVDMSEPELIVVVADGQAWTCHCDDDESFIFHNSTGGGLYLPIPADYLE